MTDRQHNFLQAILGPSGASALKKATDRSELLEQALLPRSVFAWVSNVGDFEGSIPGTDEVLLSFEKSESGFTGCVGLHKFENASVIHVAAALAVALGADKPYGEEAKSLDLERLGKSLDLLVRSKLIQDRLEKSEEEDDDKLSDEEFERKYDCERLKTRKAARAKSEELNKAAMEAPVKSAAPEAPAPTVAPIAAGQSPATKPVAPKPMVAKAPKLPKPAGATVALARSEMSHLCPMCASPQFTGDELNPCVCFADLKKSIEILHLDELGCVLHIEESMPDIVTFLEAMGRG